MQHSGTNSEAWKGPKALQAQAPMLDPQLQNTLREAFTKYENMQIDTCRDEICQNVSDILYDELVFRKVVQQVDLSYHEEIRQLAASQAALQSEQAELMLQRKADLSRLHAERQKRLNTESAVAVRHKHNQKKYNLQGNVSMHSFETKSSGPLPSSPGRRPKPHQRWRRLEIFSLCACETTRTHL